MLVLVAAHGIFDLHCRIFFFFKVWHTGCFGCGMQSTSCRMWDPVPDQRLNPGPLLWACGVPATGPLGASLYGLDCSNRVVHPDNPRRKLNLDDIICILDPCTPDRSRLISWTREFGGFFGIGYFELDL